MPTNSRENLQKPQITTSNAGFLLIVILSVAALAVTFLISLSETTFIVKLISFLVITIVYIFIAAFAYRKLPKPFSIGQPQAGLEDQDEKPEKTFSTEIEEKLLALEEANSIFGTSLKPADMFRLVSNRINEIIPFSISALYLSNVGRKKLKISYAFGRGATSLDEIEIDSNEGIAGKSFQSGEMQTDQELSVEKNIFPLDYSGDLQSAIACPLVYEADTYGVLVLYSAEKNEFGAEAKKLLKAVGARISPLFLSSITFENNLNNALNDSVTNLPNERALFMMLENQVAESQRFREQRPLTVLSFDIKNFAELNNTYGHATGDRILSFVAKNIKEQLRQMDFLSRLASDEFLAVLPTSSDRTTEMIVERIKDAFASNPFTATSQNKVFIELNFGQASFIKDGETAQDLLKIAAIKKREAKSAIKSTVLWFPKEYSN